MLILIYFMILMCLWQGGGLAAWQKDVELRACW